jgi:rifampicin phosphotransferase
MAGRAMNAAMKAPMTTWILDPVDALDSPHAGGKARALARAARGGLSVPAWVVLSDAAFLQSNPSTLSGILEGEVRSAVDAAVRTLCPMGERLAVRSSACDEDGVQHSFAGQLASFLNVAPEDAAARVRDVWRSAFEERALRYRRERGLPASPRPPAVILQRMVEACVAGVAFSADPVSGRRGVAVVSAVRGLGAALVSGEVDAHTWQVCRDGTILERHVSDTSRPTDRPVLTDEQVRAVAGLAADAERLFGCPQDIEWAIGDRLMLLQSRPITSLRSHQDQDAPPTIWDNSNIVESYSGVTAPLTFSFAREIYPPVYREFCRMMGVPRRVIARHDDTFLNVLGLVRGRLYYNLLNWYRILALLPAYRMNRRFLEQMMGVEQALPDEQADAIATQVSCGRFADGLRLARTVVGLVANHVTLNWRITAFNRRLAIALAPAAPPLADCRPDELVGHYRALRSRLLLNWDAPLVNDFFAMVFYGLLRRLVARWCGDDDATLQNELIGGEGGMVSAEPAILIQGLARLAATDTALLERLSGGRLPDIRADLEHRPELRDGCRDYLAKFGDRTFNELKLESVSLNEDPLPLFRAIGAFGRQIAAARSDRHAPSSPSGDERRAAAWARVSQAIAGHPIRRQVLSWVLKHARRRVRDRENLRLERTRLFARVRQIFLELGRRLHAVGVLDAPRDVLYLEVDEVLAFVDGRSTCTDLRSLAALRCREFRAYEEGPVLPNRFETHGSPYHEHENLSPEHVASGFSRTSEGPPEGGHYVREDQSLRVHSAGARRDDERRGLGCSPGVVRGPVRVVTDPRRADLSTRSILVAEHTDPGWIMVFPAALAVLVERGSVLSHAAIVARELGIPAVVSLPGVTDWLSDGDWIEMDGSTGVVRRVASPQAHERTLVSVEGAVAHAS